MPNKFQVERSVIVTSKTEDVEHVVIPEKTRSNLIKIVYTCNFENVYKLTFLGPFKSCVKLFWPFYDPPPIPFPCCHAPGVVYFEQCLDAAHLKHWSKYAFSHFLHEKYRKRNKKKVKNQNYPRPGFGCEPKNYIFASFFLLFVSFFTFSW